ncbi:MULTISPECIES: heme ABC transporter ATP-binding protein [unclassified Photobacterium]|uniref:heme ABC transporter ATP-binding protein n=1 Tax=unclassified Photobacterium TaxID=2628852 RepID=UPI000D17B56E|nr:MULTISPECIES: heme ABC transporter ATP-binding protein [unclassified Photobacterium]PSV30628.1 heme ABC transporter ATP-binding protein [Photobacterium sp. GB-72]PSV40190.1 heme ABC transporter ATP-binding protein [Photobacterium sp. GB-210]PSV43477.1 heme ABC transporter ATP-binding protein [Photobacterium sp. GB-36]PSV56396.1 heme ABC transporter ATP-binding protein [Photobacterium sp. GB-3]PSW72290.1 heme ABC transporter ATP-binding protein [Photobacterium sp. GB-50]
MTLNHSAKVDFTASSDKVCVIQARDLSLQFGDKVLLNHLDIDIHAGEVTALLGPNGAGKSTLLKVLCGEITPKSGTVSFFDQPLNNWAREELACHLGVLPQHSALSFAFTAKEVVELGAIPLQLTSPELKDATASSMQYVDINNLAKRLYPTLSGGEKQRVHLARVLTQLSKAGDKCILMLDEPTSALDLAHQHHTLQIAQNMAIQGAAVIVVLHDLNLAAQYTDRMIFLNEGEIKADGTPTQVLTPEVIDTLYGWPVSVHTHPSGDFPYLLSANHSVF